MVLLAITNRGLRSEITICGTEQLFVHFKSSRANRAYCEKVYAIHCDVKRQSGNLTYLDAYGTKSPPTHPLSPSPKTGGGGQVTVQGLVENFG